ncbi:MAG: DUF4129 domain-containing protein [Candidatus Poseidoniaceae archaeon]
MLENRYKKNSESNILTSVILVMLMVLSTTIAMMIPTEWDEPETTVDVEYSPMESSPAMQSMNQAGQGNYDGATTFNTDNVHPSLRDIMWADTGVASGVIHDIAAIEAIMASNNFLIEESNRDDHDNDGISDLYDLDDDNDGIYDLLERFDGCFGTDPFDHDNDGILDIDDYDDDNDGILEGPIDYEALEAQGFDPRNVSTDRYVVETTLHPWITPPTAVGAFYLADQHPFDHDNDGVTDEDTDGSGAGRFDEDDDNDGRIDQFTWPCDFDNDGVRDYFDEDDDDDGVADVEDSNPYDATITTSHTQAGNLFVAPVVWDFIDYRDYSGGVNYVTLEAARVDANDEFDWAGGTTGDGAAGVPSFTDIIDGDLDGDGIPNFIDPDNDNDGTPDSADTDDDNDGILDMFDPDDDNDGIPDVCTNVDFNNDGLSDYTWTDRTPYETPGGNTDGKAGVDCELDYDQDLDDDRLRPFDQNYNAVYDWLDPDMGGTTSPDNLGNVLVSGDATNFEYDTDDDNIDNENDSFPLDKASVVLTWNCPTAANPNPTNPDPRCQTRRASFSQFNDWDGDGVLNWEDIDDDNDGIIDILDIDWDCDLDNDGDLHAINGALYRDDGPNAVDSDIDGDGLENDIDWDDDNDGLSDLYDPDDGNCGLVDPDLNDAFQQPAYPVGDGGSLTGGADNQDYSTNADLYWSLVFLHNPFSEMMLDYNGYDGTTNPVTPGTIPEFYWFLFARWSSYNGGNEWDIDSDGDSLVNGLDIDQDGDGLPDWWDQDEGNDGIQDVNDVKMGGTFNMTSCGITVGNLGQGFVCGYSYAIAYQMPLNGVNAQFGLPYSTRPDAVVDQGATPGGASGNWSCTPGAQGGCWHYDFGGDGNTDSAITYLQMQNNRDSFVTWMGLATGIWQWNSDNGQEADFPDELGADLLQNDVDGDIDGDFYNNTIDLDDDYDSVFDWFDVDDDNDGLWDYFEVDSNDDLDDDDGQENGNFFSGTNCEDNDDDGNDADADDDGFYQAVWDRGDMTLGLLQPKVYDVDNDNDGVPDGEDVDDDNNGILDTDQELLAGCFWGEEQSTWDHDNDGIVNWADDDWDGDGITNAVELQISITQAFDHDNDGDRDDIDVDDDQDGMHDVDEVLLWPERFDRNSTNPWDHDDFGSGEALANPSDPFTGPDVIDQDDDNDTRADADWDHLEEGFSSDLCYAGALSSDWDSDNDCTLDEDDKAPTYITLDMPGNLWMDAQSPAIFSGVVQWVNPITQVLENASNLPVQIHIEWAANGTTAIETTNILTGQDGRFSVGQFLYPEDIVVGDSTTYKVYAVVTEMFAFNGATSADYLVGVEANMTIDPSSNNWEFFRSDEQQLWLEFYSYYTADYQRGIYSNPIPYAPVTFSFYGGLFGNLTEPTDFTNFDGLGYRANSFGLTSVSFEQLGGASGVWKQVQFNSTMDNGAGVAPGGLEEIIWNNNTKVHDIVQDSSGLSAQYERVNTSLPAGDYSYIGRVEPNLATEYPFPFLHGDEDEPRSMRVMHRMNIAGTMTLEGTQPISFFDATINNGDGTFGNWRYMYHGPALTAAGIDYNDASAYKPYSTLWDGNDASLTGEATNIIDFVDVNATHWFITLVNGGDADLPPCGQVDPSDPESPVRCEIVPEMDTGTSLGLAGAVSNRTEVPWTIDPIAVQLDRDRNGIFSSGGETQFTQTPKCRDALGNDILMTLQGDETECQSKGGTEAVYDYNFTWESQFSSGTYGMRVDFTNSAYYFTGNSSTLATTGAYINVTVVGTTDFQLTSIPRLYRNTNTSIQARLVDNSLQPVREAPVNYTWSFDGRTETSYTDTNGFFEMPFNITADDDLGSFTLTFDYEGTPLLKPSNAVQQVWVVSRTYVSVISTDGNIRQNGDLWDFTAQVKDDNKTFEYDSGGRDLDGTTAPNGGLVDVIFEGTDFDNVQHRQVIATLAPSAGVISLPETQPDNAHLCYYDGNGDGFADRDLNQNGVLERLETVGCLKADISPLNPSNLREDPESFLPDGFGPVNVILRFEESLPNEGCAPLDASYLGLQGQWDPCANVPGNNHFRTIMTYNANGFSLIGRTILSVDDQIVYTSEIDPVTGLVVPKPMVVTGQLTDELGTNLTDRKIRVSYEMVNGQSGPVSCNAGVTDGDGFYSIACPLSDATAGKTKVTVSYSSYDNNDAFRYDNKTVQTEFDVFSNSTLAINEVGPFKSSVDTYTVDGIPYPVLYLKESFHVDALLSQSNGRSVGGKCLNIYLDPEENIRPIATIRTSDVDGTAEWFSGDPLQNPTLRGVELTGGKKEGFRTLRVAFEPDFNIPGGCDKDVENVLNGSFAELDVLVRSRVDMQVETTWYRGGEAGVPENTPIIGEVALLRDRIDVSIENEEIQFIRQYRDETGAWVTMPGGTNNSITNEQGIARFEWNFDGRICDGEECTGEWQVIAVYAGSTNFQASQNNITFAVDYKEAVVEEKAGFFSPENLMAYGIVLMALLVASALYYRRAMSRRQVQSLRGILTDTMMQLEASNEYIKIIFDCYKNLVKHFRKYGFMKKVYETTREFEAAVRAAFNMVPPEQLDGFLTIFEEARYSDHSIGILQRDQAISTLGAITSSITTALGEDSLVKRYEGAGLYDKQTKAGEFIAADGTTRQAGIVDGESTDFKI